jgi:predicted aspartyl protease
MIGEFRDGHPRARLTLNGLAGQLELEFVVDTGFDGDLALPGHLARQLE